jgi:hypothetical protein
MTEIRKTICDGCQRELVAPYIHLESRPSIRRYEEITSNDCHAIAGVGGKDFCSGMCLYDWALTIPGMPIEDDGPPPLVKPTDTPFKRPY